MFVLGDERGLGDATSILQVVAVVAPTENEVVIIIRRQATISVRAAIGQNVMSGVSVSVFDS